MPYLTANPSHYNAIYDYCQDSGLFYSLPNEPDIVVFGNHSHYGTSINPEIIFYYDTLCTIFVFGRLHDNSRAFVIAQYGPHEYFSEQQKIENNAYINLVGNVVFVLHG